ncbi:cupin domain-containing protein [Evansella sp. LMS18]|uniref:cupin domain-containing protein n=1 Tax=Evansella sp. LMS18 TaxID=2924033 RepID=UPI0020D1AB04|nr:cupin domain-containing protein [Evansella sp. LMS18]UTR10344.1 cupin domain-containing protein [Evansella sp. LMS18]
MTTVNINKLPLLDLWYENDESKKWKVNLPFAPKFPLWSGVQTKDSSVVYFELEPGKELGEHSESGEEILFVISGNAEAVIGGERHSISEGSLVVTPPGVPHYIKNTGETPARFLGFFSKVDSRSTFSEEVSPVGMKEL